MTEAMMSDQFLYQELAGAFKYGASKPEMPESITQNLNPALPLRPYQEDAFAYFLHYFNLPDKEIPTHLLFNMATGSGQDAHHGGIDTLSL